jgi:hypothetical protein
MMSPAKKKEDKYEMTHAESWSKLYKDQFVELYLSEKSGNSFYSDNDRENKIYTSGYVREAVGPVLIFDAVLQTNVETIMKQIAINGWAITAVMPKPAVGDKTHITQFFQERRR